MRSENSFLVGAELLKLLAPSSRRPRNARSPPSSRRGADGRASSRRARNGRSPGLPLRSAPPPSRARKGFSPAGRKGFLRTACRRSHPRGRGRAARLRRSARVRCPRRHATGTACRRLPRGAGPCGRLRACGKACRRVGPNPGHGSRDPHCGRGDARRAMPEDGPSSRRRRFWSCRSCPADSRVRAALRAGRQQTR